MKITKNKTLQNLKHSLSQNNTSQNLRTKVHARLLKFDDSVFFAKPLYTTLRSFKEFPVYIWSTWKLWNIVKFFHTCLVSGKIFKLTFNILLTWFPIKLCPWYACRCTFFVVRTLSSAFKHGASDLWYLVVVFNCSHSAVCK